MNTHQLAPARPQMTAPPSSTPVCSSLLRRKCTCGGTPGPSGECEECRRKRLSLQRKSSKSEFGSQASSWVPAIVHEVLRSPGEPLDTATRIFMEPRFGHDFSNIRVHSGAQAAESAQAVNALAFTVGRNVVFGAGQYAPRTVGGQRLLGHELTHAVQQGMAPMANDRPLSMDTGQEATEREADRHAHAIGLASAQAPSQQMHRGQPLGGRVSSVPIQRVQRQMITPLGAGGGLGGLMDRDRRAAANQAHASQASSKIHPFSIETYGCHDSPYVRADIVAAARAAFDKVLNSDCVKSESLRDEILSEFDGLSIDCEQGDDDDPCGRAMRYFTQTVNLYPKALNASRCGPLASTILHEVVHLTEWRLFGHGDLADACESSCFGFGSGDASKCK